jgi:hypothetical protein
MYSSLECCARIDQVWPMQSLRMTIPPSNVLDGPLRLVLRCRLARHSGEILS